jgi:hypothetical protein
VLRRLLRTGARENPDTWYNIVRRAAFTRSRVRRRSKEIGAGELWGPGRPWRLAQARRGFFSRTDEELINYLHVTK